MQSFYLIVTSGNSFEGATVMHLEAEAMLSHFLNHVLFRKVNVYLNISNGFGRQSFSTT